jgi:hypothetical protein
MLDFERQASDDNAGLQRVLAAADPAGSHKALHPRPP